MDELGSALRAAISVAKLRRAYVIDPEDLLLGCLLVWSRFGIAWVGNWPIDLEALGVGLLDVSAETVAKPSYSDDLVMVLDRAAALARREKALRPGVVHVLACFAGETDGIMGKLRQVYGIDSASWRAALAQQDRPQAQSVATAPAHAEVADRPLLTPEEAAQYLGVHIQTIRGYIRSGKLPALRIAGERAIRLRRENLDALLEPVQLDDPDSNTTEGDKHEIVRRTKRSSRDYA